MTLVRTDEDMPIALASAQLYGAEEYIGLSGLSDKQSLQQKWAKSALKSGDFNSVYQILNGALVWLANFEIAKKAQLGAAATEEEVQAEQVKTQTTVKVVGTVAAVSSLVPVVGTAVGGVLAAGMIAFKAYKGIKAKKAMKTIKRNKKSVKRRIAKLLKTLNKRVKSLAQTMTTMQVPAATSVSGAATNQIIHAADKLGRRKGRPYWGRINGIGLLAQQLEKRLSAARVYVESTISQTPRPTPATGPVVRPDTVAPVGHVWDDGRKAWVALPAGASKQIVVRGGPAAAPVPEKKTSALVPAGIALLALKVLGG